MRINDFAKFLGISLVLLFSPGQALAQALPGVVISQSTLDQDTRRLFTLAQQAYPAVFRGASDWRSYDGIIYRYYTGSRLYAGVKDGKVLLMGGPFGNKIVEQGTLFEAIIMLEKVVASKPPAGAGADFKNVVKVKNVADISRNFQVVSMEYTSRAGSVGTTATLRVEVLGVEDIEGTTTDHLLLTLSGGNLSSPVNYDMWVDAEGTIKRLSQSGFVYGEYLGQTIGSGLVSGLLYAMAAADSPTISLALEEELKNPAFSQKVETRFIGSVQAPTLVLNITATEDTGNILFELSDFGSFSMVTRLRSEIGTLFTELEVIELKLR